MPLNFQALQPIVPSKILGQLPTSGGGGDDIGSILSGLGSLAQSFGGFSGGANVSSNEMAPQAAQNFTNPGNTYGSQSYLNNTNNPQNLGINRETPTIGIQSGLGVYGQTKSIWDNATKSLGLKEGNPALNQYLQKANPNLDPTITPWCAGFVGSVLNASGLKGTGSLMAKSYLNYGKPVEQPTMGDIAVLNRGNDPNLGHVGFVQSIDYDKGIVNILGGNQDNSVSIKSFPLTSVAGFRHPPSGQEVQQFANKNNIQNPQQLASITKPQQQSNWNILGISNANAMTTDQMKQLTSAYLQPLTSLNSTPQALPGSSLKTPDVALSTIKQFEGFANKPYWDVNAYRAGYGSDTFTRADGSIGRVKQGVPVATEDAERDLVRRTNEFATSAAKQVGQKVWDNFSPKTQAALTSIAYNYGSLPKRILPAVKSGNAAMIVEAIRGLGSDNKGINSQRRNKEANMVLEDLQPNSMYANVLP